MNTKSIFLPVHYCSPVIIVRMTQQLRTVKHFKLDNTAFDTSANENDAMPVATRTFYNLGDN
jgi:hypothetical protein